MNEISDIFSLKKHKVFDTMYSRDQHLFTDSFIDKTNLIFFKKNKFAYSIEPKKNKRIMKILARIDHRTVLGTNDFPISLCLLVLGLLDIWFLFYFRSSFYFRFRTLCWCSSENCFFLCFFSSFNLTFFYAIFRC